MSNFNENLIKQANKVYKKVSRIISKDILVLEEQQQSIQDILKTMNDKRIKRAQIVTIEGKLTKVLTTNDLLVMLTKERDTLTTTYYKIH